MYLLIYINVLRFGFSLNHFQCTVWIRCIFLKLFFYEKRKQKKKKKNLILSILWFFPRSIFLFENNFQMIYRIQIRREDN